MRKIKILLMIMLVTIIASACGGNPSSKAENESNAEEAEAIEEPEPDPVTLTLFADITIAPKIEAAKTEFVRDNSHVTINTTYAPNLDFETLKDSYDIYIGLEGKEGDQCLANDKVALVVPNDNFSNIVDFEDIANRIKDHTAMAAVGGEGTYNYDAGQKFIKSSNIDEDDPSIYPCITYDIDDTRTGDWLYKKYIDAAIVYLSDAIRNNYRIVALMDNDSGKGIFPVTVNSSAAEASDFADFISGKDIIVDDIVIEATEIKEPEIEEPEITESAEDAPEDEN